MSVKLPLKESAQSKFVVLVEDYNDNADSLTKLVFVYISRLNEDCLSI